MRWNLKIHFTSNFDSVHKLGNAEFSGEIFWQTERNVDIQNFKDHIIWFWCAGLTISFVCFSVKKDGNTNYEAPEIKGVGRNTRKVKFRKRKIKKIKLTSVPKSYLCAEYKVWQERMAERSEAMQTTNRGHLVLKLWYWYYFIWLEVVILDLKEEIFFKSTFHAFANCNQIFPFPIYVFWF